MNFGTAQWFDVVFTCSYLHIPDRILDINCFNFIFGNILYNCLTIKDHVLYIN